MRRRDKFDHLVVGNNGGGRSSAGNSNLLCRRYAEPAGSLDAVVTVVDALHIWSHWEE